MVGLMVERYMAASFLLIGLSHGLRPEIWCTWFTLLARHRIAAVAITLCTFPVGLVIVLLHNDWSWRPGLIVTISGWGMCLKCAIYSLFPEVAQRKAAEMEGAEAKMRAAGLIFFTVGVVLALGISL